MNRKEKQGTQWISYGDGATWTAEDKAGWGICMEKIDPTVGRRVQPREYCKEAKCRVEGEQRNDSAEAQAILEALLRVHLRDDMLILSDNQGCVDSSETLWVNSLVKQESRVICIEVPYASSKSDNDAEEAVGCETQGESESSREAAKDGTMVLPLKEEGRRAGAHVTSR